MTRYLRCGHDPDEALAERHFSRRARNRNRFAANVDAVAIPVRGVLVAQWERTLELRGPGAPKTYAVTASARLAGAAGRRAVFLSRGKVRLLNLYTGQRRAVVSGSAAQFEERWLTYASGRSVRVRRLARAS